LKKKYRFILYFTILIIFAIWVGIWYVQDYYPATKPVERYFGVSLPEDATDVQAQYNWAFQGGNYFLQFKLPSQQFDAFKRKVCGDQELSADYNQEATRNRVGTPGWWLPDITSISVSSRCLFPEGGYFEFYVDWSDENLFFIYMRGFIT
jgi:hypothetical protein